MLTGSAPVANMRDYAAEVAAYTRGQGRLFCTLKGYEVCHNQEEVVEAVGYNSEQDLDNPADSVFCSHGGRICGEVGSGAGSHASGGP